MYYMQQGKVLVLILCGGDKRTQQEDIRLYLKACQEEGGDDPALVTHTLGVVACARNMSQLARDSGLTRVDLYKTLSPEGNPSFATAQKVAKGLGLKLTIQPISD